ncbi:MAG: HD domain-containing protein [Longimicrobiales bacterium]|nr:HD domain-containing protein [Longimicrobiales bacterium]
MVGATSEVHRSLLRALYSALRTVGSQPATSPEAVRWVQRTRAALEPYLEGSDPLLIRVLRSQLYFGGDPAPNDIGSFVYHAHVLATLKEAGVGAVQFRSLPDPRELETFLRLLERVSAPQPDPSKVQHLRKGMAARGIRSIVVASAAQIDDAYGPGASKEAAKRTYRLSIQVSRELFTGTRLGRSANVAEVRQAVQGIVEGVLSDEASLGGLSALRSYDDYLFTHAVNVCIFCVAIGRRLGLSKAQLYDLGHAALVHDLGMSRIPREILTKPSALSPEERRIMQSHTWLGALSVFDLRDYGDIPLHSMIAAYEHHLRPDGTGYPEQRRLREPTIFSKIIAVAAAFDAATNERAYQEGRPADKVMLELWKDESRGFDPVVVKALINLLGIYPVGTCVILDSYELALVHSANSDAAFLHRPVVRLLSDADGVWLQPAPLVDLADTDDSGRFARSIIKVTSPERYGIDVSHHLG